MQEFRSPKSPFSPKRQRPTAQYGKNMGDKQRMKLTPSLGIHKCWGMYPSMGSQVLSSSTTKYWQSLLIKATPFQLLPIIHIPVQHLQTEKMERRELAYEIVNNYGYYQRGHQGSDTLKEGEHPELSQSWWLLFYSKAVARGRGKQKKEGKSKPR